MTLLALKVDIARNYNLLLQRSLQKWGLFFVSTKCYIAREFLFRIDMSRIYLKSGRERSVFYQHPWIFSGGIAKVEKVKDGAIAEIYSANGEFLAEGYYNSACSIAVRILSFGQKLAANWLEQKIVASIKRRNLLSEYVSKRLVFAESDFLPGLVVDLYHEENGNKYLVYQISTLGMDQLRANIEQVLHQLYPEAVIIERSDLAVRKQEGLTELSPEVRKGVLSGPITIVENGVKLIVDLLNGQKTGFFLDQRENRAVVQKYATGKKVLNLFAYTGGFSLQAALAGAKTVVSVDISENAGKICESNFAVNFPRFDHQLVVKDAFEYLEEAIADGVTFDVVIVDPPAFVKSKDKLDQALKAYVGLNALALKVLAADGLLISSSCSGYIDHQTFRGMLFQSAIKSGCDLQIVEQKTQPLDHPILVTFPEGEYLKFLVARKISP